MLDLLALICLIPVAGGSVYGLGCVIAAFRFRAQRLAGLTPSPVEWPPVTIIKPLYGLDKNQEANIRSFCVQDYPSYQLVLAVQRLDDPALPLLRRIEAEFGSDRVTLVVEPSAPVVNGKVQNMVNALARARHEVLVISDSDVVAQPDYLKSIVAPLFDPRVGYACTYYRATGADTWYEKLELLTLNAEFTPDLLFASMTGVSDFCLGASTALRRSTLESIGGMQSLAEYLVEDYEMGRRICARGMKAAIVAHIVDLVVDRRSRSDWWHHTLYWDQNTRAARPLGFLATVLVRGLPFALAFALLRGLDATGVSVLLAVLGLRLATVATVLHYGLDDGEGLRALWLLPLRDLAGVLSWLLALRKKTFVWRGHTFRLAPGGRIEPAD